jgi:hypothetical protein
MTYYGLGVSRNTTKGGNQLPRRRRGLRGAVLTVSLALVLVLVLAACSSSGSSTAASNKGSAPTTAGTGSPATVSPLPSKVVEMMGNASVAWVRSPSGASVGIVRYSFPGSGFAINFPVTDRHPTLNIRGSICARGRACVLSPDRAHQDSRRASRPVSTQGGNGYRVRAGAWFPGVPADTTRSGPRLRGQVRAVDARCQLRQQSPPGRPV